jgi:Domain of unknown function (DUF4907)
MQNRLTTIKYFLAAILIFLSGCSTHDKTKIPNANIPVFTSLAVQEDGKTTGAWGYVILRHDKLLIQQFTVPALEGNKQFAGKEEAAMTGRLVAKKLNSGNHPGITKQELDSLGIIKIHDDKKER